PLLAMAAGIATGSTAQAVLGACLVRWCFRAAFPPERVPAVFAFLGLVAGVCSVGATCGALSLYLGGLVGWTEWTPVWTTWWLGDCAGVLVVTPPLLVFGLTPRLSGFFDRGILLFVCTGVGLSLIGYAIGQNPPEYLQAGRTWQPWMVLLGCLSFASLLTVYLGAQRRAADKLRLGEERYRLLVENMSDVIWTADLDLRLTYISPSVQRLTGFS